MKRRSEDIIHNSKAVVGRNLPFVLRYLFFTAGMIILLSFCTYSLFIWIALIYNAYMLIRSIFIFVMDYLDSALGFPGLSDFRKRCYDRRISKIKNRLAALKSQREFLMPYQTASSTAMPQVMLSNISDFTGSRR